MYFKNTTPKAPFPIKMQRSENLQMYEVIIVFRIHKCPNRNEFKNFLNKYDANTFEIIYLIYKLYKTSVLNYYTTKIIIQTANICGTHIYLLIVQ